MLPDLMVEVDNCPDMTAISHLRKAARRFCEKTHVWTTTLADFNTVASQGAYPLSVPAGSSPVRLASVSVGDERDVSLLDLEEARAAMACGRQSSFAWIDAGQLHIGPTPARAVPVSVQLSLKPSQAADGIPDWMAEDHMETLHAGAKASLFGMPRKDWTNEAEAAEQEARFLSACNAAAINKTKGRARIKRRTATFY